MALVNYSDLKASVKKWSKREDVDALLEDFIDLCETEIYENTVEPLRLRSMIVTETSATSDSVRTQALPTNFLETRRIDLTISTVRTPIDYVTPAAQIIRTGTAIPSNYTITDQIEYDIIPDAAYVTNIVHYARLTPLSDAAPTNDIITNHSNIYLYGTLAILYQYAQNNEESAKYKALFIAAINGANTSDDEGNRGVASQRTRRGRNP